jgi:RNA polymerase sigma-70 factor (ECF subfamily)
LVLLTLDARGAPPFAEQRRRAPIVPNTGAPPPRVFLGTITGRGSFTPRVAITVARFPLEAPAPSLQDTTLRWYGSLMRRQSRESEPSFGAQLLPHADALYNFARYLCRDAALAEDLMQDAFARALDAEAQFSPGTNLKAWLFRILRNAFLDRRRRERKNPVELREVSDDADDSKDVWLRGDLELDRLRGVVVSDIEAALARLSDDARSVVLLDLEGFTETEIAKVMDTAVGTVKSRLARARAVLREALQEYAK